MRALVDQTFERFIEWRRRLGLEDDLGVHCVMGGVSWSDHDWRLHPERDAVFVGTVDMLLSRALNRGFADSRWNWPMSFGAFNSGCQWVFDETQLMDTAVSTGRQLQAFRDRFGTVQPTRTTWMSATVDFDNLVTVDAPAVDHVVGATAADRAHPNLAARLDAPRSVRQIGAGTAVEDRQVAQLAIEHHRPGTLTLAVVNTVQRAQTAFKAVQKATHGVDTVLIHSRFRQADREAALARLINRGEHGMIAIATQVAEAGLDISATTLLTDLAPWSSLVQRAGRCNRTGTIVDAQMLWMRPGRAAPYDEEGLEAAEAALTQLPDVVTPRMLSAVVVPTKAHPRPTLRRRDLVELFDTLPDLSGNDVDVGRFIRDSEDRDVVVLWREVEKGELASDVGPGTAELCRVPIGQLRRFLRTQLKKPSSRAFNFKAVPRERERWTRLTTIGDLRPNLALALDAKMGGYTPELGWYGTKSNKTVPAVAERADQRFLPDRHDQRVGDDPNSTVHPVAWLSLKEHLEDTEAAASDMVDAFGALDLSADMVQAARLAARYHDIGKAHDVFQDAIRKTQGDGDAAPPASEVVLAKGGSRLGALRYSRPHFRHGLVSALMLLGPERALLEGVAEPDLVVYLAAAHHGRVRLGARRLDDERCPPGNADCYIALGVVDGDHLRAGVELPDAVTSGGPVSLAHVGLGSGDGPALSYTARMLALRDRSDLGPFRLAWLEMLVRAADWRASAHPRAVRP